MTAKESCDALGVEISRRNRLVQNAKKIPGSLCTPDKRNCTPTLRGPPQDCPEQTLYDRVDAILLQNFLKMSTKM